MRDLPKLLLPPEDVESGAVFAREDQPLRNGIDSRSPIVFTPDSSGSAKSPFRFDSPRSSGRRPASYLNRAGYKKPRKRAIFKNGYCNVSATKVPHQQIRFLQDIFTTLVDAQWRWTLLVFALGFVGSWLLFGALYWLISYSHGDFEEGHLPPVQAEHNWTPCISNIYSFTSCFLFSLETQHTIGYGSRAMEEECPEAVFVMSLQSVHGVMVQAFLAGIVFAKMARSKRRAQTLLFSRNAVISMRDGELCLMFRIGDMRKSHIIGANIRAQLIRGKVSAEGESMPQYRTELELSSDDCSSDVFFIWPQIVVHRIDEKSPLYGYSAEDILLERFEIVVVLEGTVESTGQTTQARTSYVNTEILWGQRFEQVLMYNADIQSYDIDFSKFNETVAQTTPRMSAKQLKECYKLPLKGRSCDPLMGVELRLSQMGMENERVNPHFLFPMFDRRRSRSSTEL
ncbi:G protein-activated inward rectifier potassium channel 3-like [Anopheles ziemanni]|uniref:G protein-activated inward rectifier potassium channel 3-like n=1 Tax=Anopheles coustani TaxID=139045 RepID=UPI002659E8C5|nr:G protein-activated inward rectifier potassium channel 3-like [Anopheles coustani]XP_058174877.1 G protein-activated inward rectifier potassium channel 3-like [Anopheles ziemanni]